MQTRKTPTAVLGIVHPRFGRADNPPTGEPFNPLAYCADPGRFGELQLFARRRARAAMLRGRFGTANGDKEATHSGRVTRSQRESMLDDAVTAFLDFFLHRDYAAAGIDSDNVFGAVLSAARWLDRARWRPVDTVRHGEYGAAPYPYHHPVDPSPDRIARAAETVGVDPETAAAAIIGTGTDEGDGRFPVSIPGGPSGRGATDGRMEWRETVVREWIEVDADGQRFQCTETAGEWRMKRGRGRKRSLPAAVVIDAPPAGPRRYARQPVPRPAAVRDAGPRCGVRHMAADPEAYRAALVVYYAARD